MTEQNEQHTVEVEAHDDTDVEAALQRETQDGSGFESEDELPESDFAGYATNEVEKPS